MLEILNAKHTITKNTCVSLGLSLNSEISDNEGGMIGAYSSFRHRQTRMEFQFIIILYIYIYSHILIYILIFDIGDMIMRL